MSGELRIRNVVAEDLEGIRRHFRRLGLQTMLEGSDLLVPPEQKLTIRCRGQATFVADEMLFSRAINNLVENAAHHTPSGGTIEISVASSEVSVKDDGAGIAPEHLQRVFDRFYRADTSRSSEGVGLGLALVKSIMDLHGGTARIESEPGRGTTVTLTFPKS